MGSNANIYCRYITDNLDKVAARVNKQFESSKKSIKAQILQEIRKYLSPIPVHYEWEYDGCLYDYSGVLKENGYVSLDQSISEFLEKEYSGCTEATYVSHCGLRYLTYGDLLSEFTYGIGEDILQKSVRRLLEEKFETTIPDELFYDIMDECHDIIFDSCLASEFFTYETPVNFIGIGQLKLSQMIE